MRGFTALIGLISELVGLYKLLVSQKKEDSFRADIEAINDNTDAEWSKLAHKQLLDDTEQYTESAGDGGELPTGSTNPSSGK